MSNQLCPKSVFLNVSVFIFEIITVYLKLFLSMSVSLGNKYFIYIDTIELKFILIFMTDYCYWENICKFNRNRI